MIAKIVLERSLVVFIDSMKHIPYFSIFEDQQLLYVESIQSLIEVLFYQLYEVLL
jgi:hypothetical protein